MSYGNKDIVFSNQMNQKCTVGIRRIFLFISSKYITIFNHQVLQ